MGDRFGRVNHLGAEPGTQAYSTWARPLWVGWNEYPAKAGGLNRHIARYTSLYLWSCSIRWCLLAEEPACGDQRRCTGGGCVLRGVYSDTTQLSWPSWTAYSQVSRVFVYDVMTYKLSQLSWVELCRYKHPFRCVFATTRYTNTRSLYRRRSSSLSIFAGSAWSSSIHTWLSAATAVVFSDQCFQPAKTPFCFRI